MTWAPLEILLCSQKQIDRQTKLPANTLQMLSLPVSSIIAKRSIHFFQGLYYVVSNVRQGMCTQITHPTLGLWKDEHWEAT